MTPWSVARSSSATPQATLPPTGRSFVSSQFACASEATAHTPVMSEASSSSAATTSSELAPRRASLW